MPTVKLNLDDIGADPDQPQFDNGDDLFPKTGSSSSNIDVTLPIDPDAIDDLQAAQDLKTNQDLVIINDQFDDLSGIRSRNPLTENNDGAGGKGDIDPPKPDIDRSDFDDDEPADKPTPPPVEIRREDFDEDSQPLPDAFDVVGF